VRDLGRSGVIEMGELEDGVKYNKSNLAWTKRLFFLDLRHFAVAKKGFQFKVKKRNNILKIREKLN
jgi:hypothetical protein